MSVTLHRILERHALGVVLLKPGVCGVRGANTLRSSLLPRNTRREAGGELKGLQSGNHRSKTRSNKSMIQIQATATMIKAVPPPTIPVAISIAFGSLIPIR